MRIGLLAAETSGDQALGKLADQLRRAADDGFASFWMANIFGLDALTALAVAGSQVPGIELGTAVVPTYPRHPAVLAQQALTAALAVGPGRLSAHIGLSVPRRAGCRCCWPRWRRGCCTWPASRPTARCCG
jgi:5,10-methylenetetrahydromethanopterin reductase